MIGIAETNRQGAVGVISAGLLHPIAKVAQLQPFNDTPRKWCREIKICEGDCAPEGGHCEPVCHTPSKGYCATFFIKVVDEIEGKLAGSVPISSHLCGSSA